MTSNYRMRMLLINPTTNKAFVTRIPNNLTPENRKLSQTFMTVQRLGIESINKKVSTRTDTTYDWTDNEQVVRRYLWPIRALMYSSKEGQTPVIVSEKLLNEAVAQTS